MKLSLSRDIAAPVETVFAEIAAFDAMEQGARDRGVEIQRTDDRGSGAPGATWDVRFDFRGRSRQGKARIVAFEPDQQIAVEAAFGDIASLADVELAPLSPHSTRLSGSVDLRAVSMTGRLLVQSLKLARGSLQQRLDSRLDAFARRLEGGES